MNEGPIKTSPRQNIKQQGSHAASYVADGHQAYYMIKAGEQETWYTSAEVALDAYESMEAGVELWMKRVADNSLTKIR